MATLEKDHTAGQDEALLDIYRKLRPGEPPTRGVAQTLLENLFFNPKRYDLAKVGRYKANKKLGLDTETSAGTLTEEDIVATIEYLVRLHAGETTMPAPRRRRWRVETDDIDHFGNRRLRTVGELIQNQVRVGLSRMERVVRERMTTQDVEAITPQTLINIRPVVAAIKEFFGTSQLSQFMDQTNPLAGLTHKRRLSALGPGGLSRERAGFEVRDVHPSHYGRMCPIETPEGPNIGLIGSLATFAPGQPVRVHRDPVPQGRSTAGSPTQIDYLTADEEDRYVIAQANAPLDADGNFAEDRVLVRRKGGEVDYISPDERRLHGRLAAPDGVGRDGDDPVPRARRRQPRAHGRQHAAPGGAAAAQRGAAGRHRHGAARRGRRRRRRRRREGRCGRGALAPTTSPSWPTTAPAAPTGCAKFRRSNQGTCINQKPIVDEGDRVEVGQVIADGPCTENGEMALGKNLLVAFMPWEGHNYEDAIILSQRLVQDDVLTSIHIEEHEVDARDTKLGAEEITRDIPNVSEEVLADLDERGIIRIGAEVQPGDILVGKVTPKGETELTPEERLLRAIFGEKAREVRDTSLKVPHGENGKVIGVRVFSREDERRAAARRQRAGPRLRGPEAQDPGRRQARRPPRQQGRHRQDPARRGHAVPGGRHPGRHHPEPHGVPRRMNIGQVLETHLGWVAKSGWEIEGKPDWASKTARGALRPCPPARRRRRRCSTAPRRTRSPVCSARRCPTVTASGWSASDGKAQLFDGRSGEPFPYPVSVGYMYILKLPHLVDDKIHARSTGPYSMITQQPLGGKAQFGGQRFGEMECWAMQAYGAAYTLQELLTIKSDDVLGRVKVYEAIVKGENIPEPGIPESFKVLLKELQSLCLNVEVLSSDGAAIEMRDTDDEDLCAGRGEPGHQPVRRSASSDSMTVDDVVN